MQYTLPELHGKGAKTLHLASLTYGDFFAFHGDQQLTIPIFQRRFCWTRAMISRWFFDILGASAQPDPHRTGKAYFLEQDGRICVLDGQQRLTTATLFLLALRDLLNDDEEGEGKEEMLSGIHEALLLDDGRTPRLWPSEPDRAAFTQLLGGASALGASALGAAYAELRERLLGLPRGEWRRALEGLMHHTVLMHLFYRGLPRPAQVFLFLQEKSLFSMGALLHNPTPGLKFHAVDLVRNLVFAPFLEMPPPELEALYRELWMPLEREMGLDDLDACVLEFARRKKAQAATAVPQSSFAQAIPQFQALEAKGLRLVSRAVLTYAEFLDVFEHEVHDSIALLKLLAELKCEFSSSRTVCWN